MQKLDYSFAFSPFKGGISEGGIEGGMWILTFNRDIVNVISYP